MFPSEISYKCTQYENGHEIVWTFISSLFVNVLVFRQNYTTLRYFLRTWQINPPDPTDISDIIEKANEPGGIVQTLTVAAGTEVAPEWSILGTFLNEEADNPIASSGNILTTTSIIYFPFFVL